MAGSKTGSVWAVCLLAITVHAAAAEGAYAGPPNNGVCVVPALPEPAKPARQNAAISKTGTIPGLGAVSGVLGWDNRQQLTLSGADFDVTRIYTPLTREVAITISGRGEAPLVIRVGGTEGLTVTRGGHVIRGTSDADALRAVLGGRAVAAFRERIGNYERRLLAGASLRADDPHAYGFLLVGAFVGSMAGDSTAMGRARDLIMQRITRGMRPVRFDFRDCVTDYELYLLDIDKQRTQCLDGANSRSSWYARAADRLGCEAEFMAQAMAGEGQFLSCTALGALL
jgi:hypothetical protein